MEYYFLYTAFIAYIPSLRVIFAIFGRIFKISNFLGLYLTAESKNVMTNARFVLFRPSRVGLKKIPWKNIV